MSKYVTTWSSAYCLEEKIYNNKKKQGNQKNRWNIANKKATKAKKTALKKKLWEVPAYVSDYECILYVYMFRSVLHVHQKLNFFLFVFHNTSMPWTRLSGSFPKEMTESKGRDLKPGLTYNQKKNSFQHNTLEETKSL